MSKWVVVLICGFQVQIALAKKIDLVVRTLKTQKDCVQSEKFLYICGDYSSRLVFEGLIEDIVKTKIGFDTWQAIQNSGHNLMIVHNPLAVLSAGRAEAELSFKLTNGICSSVIIYFHAGIPANGSHIVAGTKEEWTEFTKRQNFFYELSHARHKMNGTWEIMQSEDQAIKDENIFRSEENPGVINLRSLNWDKGEHVWLPLLG